MKNRSGQTTAPPSSVPPLAAAVPASRYALFLCVALIGLGQDLVTKQAIFRWRGLPRPGNEWWIIEPFFGIETSVNPGALFGMGAGYWWLFSLLSVAAAVGIFVWLFVFGAARDRWLTFALGAVTGGILGNLYDRLGLAGLPPHYTHGVRDWILLRYGQYTWPNFNVADMLLVTGAIMLVLHAFVWQEKPKAAAAEAEK
ncbi:MAG: signal peptidase II [Pirellulaceae bacterium]|nr:signal peptidase II [Pirellulaceae bacterium]